MRDAQQGPRRHVDGGSLCRPGVARMPRSTTVLSGELELPSAGPMNARRSPTRASHLPRCRWGSTRFRNATQGWFVMRAFYAVHFETPVDDIPSTRQPSPAAQAPAQSHRRHRHTGGEAQPAHLFVCGRECGRKRRGTTRTTRHREHLSRISPDSAFVQVNAQIQRQDEEPARGLEPPTPCLQDRCAASCATPAGNRAPAYLRPDRGTAPRRVPWGRSLRVTARLSCTSGHAGRRRTWPT